MLNAVLTARAAQSVSMSAIPQRSDPYAEGLALSGQGRHVEAISQFEAALQRKPDDCKVLFALGNTARAIGMADAAETFYGRVLALEPARIEALVNLANLLRSRGSFAAAEALLRPALARDPNVPELWLTLGSVLRETDRNAEAEEHYREALRLRPDYAAALGNIADMRASASDHAEALALYDRALKRDGGNAQLRLNRAMLHFAMGNLSDGWRDYSARLKLPGKIISSDHGLAPWNGNSLRGKRLLVTAEQGIGDQIMFASLIPELIAWAASEDSRIVVECEPRLVPLFTHSFERATVHASDMENRGGQTLAHYDWLKRAGGANRAIAMGSLPRYLRQTAKDFPAAHTYLSVDDAEAAKWRAFFAENGNGPHIGICWRSGKLGGARNVQYAPLEMWGAFLRDVRGTIVCAQYDAPPEEIATLEEISGRKIVVPSALDQKNEIDRTAAMLSVLDVVISAPTAVAWLSAASGVKTLKLLYDTSWTSFGETYEPFAPACECVMPGKSGDWKNAFAKAAALISRLP